jgi:hypothetical protein
MGFFKTAAKWTVGGLIANSMIQSTVNSAIRESKKPSGTPEVNFSFLSEIPYSKEEKVFQICKEYFEANNFKYQRETNKGYYFKIKFVGGDLCFLRLEEVRNKINFGLRRRVMMLTDRVFTEQEVQIFGEMFAAMITLVYNELGITPPGDKNKSSPENIADEIEKLHDLMKKGILTEEEFNNQKKKLLR